MLCQHTNNFLLKLTLCCVDTSFRSWYNTWEKSNKSLKHKVEYLRASPKALHRLSRIRIRLNNIFFFCLINTKCWCNVFIRHKNGFSTRKSFTLALYQQRIFTGPRLGIAKQCICCINVANGERVYYCH